jgi:aspartyl-tRNA(Asn)/glutamyl-tRNA(Gln) amidotransferase subunit A
MQPWNRDFHLRGSFRQLRVGVPLEYNITEMDPAVRDAWQNVLEIFQSQGCTLVPISLPNTKHALSAYYVLAAAEAASNLSKYDGVRYGNRADSNDGEGSVLYSQTRGEGFGEEVKRRILLGSYTLSSKAIDNYFIKAQKVRRLVQRDFDRVFSLPNPLRDGEQFDLSEMDESVGMENKLGPPQVDFIVCPTAPTLPPLQRWVTEQSPVDSYMNDVFTVPSSLAGLPAISLPFRIPRENRSPNDQSFAGIQLIGQYSDDYRLLVTAKTIELLHEGATRFLDIRKDVVRKHRPPFVKRHWATKVPITKFVSAPKVISKYLSGNGSPRASILKTASKKDTDPGVRISKHPSAKGDYPSREPHSEKEITQSVEDAFEEWESMISGQR